MTKKKYEIRIIMSVTSEIAAAVFPSGFCDRGVLPSTDILYWYKCPIDRCNCSMFAVCYRRTFILYVSFVEELICNDL